MIKILMIALVVMMFAVTAGAAEEQEGPAEPLPVKVLILPKFETGNMTGDAPGEAQLFYEEQLPGAEGYTVQNAPGMTLYYRDGIALCVLGMGRVIIDAIKEGRF